MTICLCSEKYCGLNISDVCAHPRKLCGQCAWKILWRIITSSPGHRGIIRCCCFVVARLFEVCHSLTIAVENMFQSCVGCSSGNLRTDRAAASSFLMRLTSLTLFRVSPIVCGQLPLDQTHLTVSTVAGPGGGATPPCSPMTASPRSPRRPHVSKATAKQLSYKQVSFSSTAGIHLRICVHCAKSL